MFALADDTLARWQFATTTIYHFLFVPISIGLALVVATMQSFAYRRRGTSSGEVWDRAARFWGRLLLVVFAMGIVTGIVQEFQFGMNWSAYSRFVGDVFGAPLALEGLIAFFLESTFLGLWVFGRNILSPRVHLATIWLAAVGTAVSAYFILAANSWMQHPVGYRIDPVSHRAELTDIWRVLTQKTALVTFTHTFMAALLTGGALLLSVSAWHLRHPSGEDRLHLRVIRLSLALMLVAVVGVTLSGHIQGQVMTQQQPMKMAAAEAAWNTSRNAPFSLFAYGDVTHGRNKFDIKVPDGLSILATDHPSGRVEGINDVQAAEQAKFGPGNYIPIVGLAYWAFRLMIGFGILAGLLALVLFVQWRRGTLQQNRRLLGLAVWAIALPTLANTFGWVFTETARQPWVVYGVLTTRAGVSTNVSNAMVLMTLVGFTALYGALAVVAVRLFVRLARKGPDPVDDTPPDASVSDEGVLSLVY